MGEDSLCVTGRQYDRPTDIHHTAIRLGIERGVFERVPVADMDAFMARPELTPAQIAASRDSLRRVQEMLRGRIDAESFRSIDMGVFEREQGQPGFFPEPPESYQKGIAAVKAGAKWPSTREGLVELLDDAVRHARGPVPLPIYDPSSSGYAGR